MTDDYKYAKDKVQQFLHRFPPKYRDGNLVFAAYAAFPAIFTPEFLHLLWLNFNAYQKEDEVKTIHAVAVSDILQSNLCQEIGTELYEMDEQVRKYLSDRSHALFQDRQLQLMFDKKELAAFTLLASEKLFTHPHRKNIRDVLYWKSVTILSPDYAGLKMAEVLKGMGDKETLSVGDIQLLLQVGDLQEELDTAEVVKTKFNRYPALSVEKGEKMIFSQLIRDENILEVMKKHVQVDEVEEVIIEGTLIENDKTDIKNNQAFINYCLKLLEEDRDNIYKVIEICDETLLNISEADDLFWQIYEIGEAYKNAHQIKNEGRVYRRSKDGSFRTLTELVEDLKELILTLEEYDDIGFSENVPGVNRKESVEKFARKRWTDREIIKKIRGTYETQEEAIHYIQENFFKDSRIDKILVKHSIPLSEKSELFQETIFILYKKLILNKENIDGSLFDFLIRTIEFIISNQVNTSKITKNKEDAYLIENLEEEKNKAHNISLLEKDFNNSAENQILINKIKGNAKVFNEALRYFYDIFLKIFNSDETLNHFFLLQKEKSEIFQEAIFILYKKVVINKYIINVLDFFNRAVQVIASHHSKNIRITKNETDGYFIEDLLKREKFIEEGVGNLKKLIPSNVQENETILDLSNRRLTELPFTIKKYTQLKRLNASHNSLKNVDIISTLINLEELDLSYNEIEDLSFLKDLMKLKILNLANNKIFDIDIFKLDIKPKNNTLHKQFSKNLQILNFNKVSTKDTGYIKNFPRLKFLDLAKNPIENDTITYMLSKLLTFDDNKINLDLFIEIEKYFFHSFSNFNKNEKTTIFTYLLNFGANEIKKGNSEFNQDIFDLYKLAIENNFLIDKQEHISPRQFQNIINVGCSLRQFDWVRDFIEEYKQFLKISIRTEYVNLAYIIIFFREEKFNDVISTLNKTVFKNFTVQLIAKIYFLASSYELNIDDNLIEKCNSLIKYIRRHPEIGGINQNAGIKFGQILKKIVLKKVSREQLEQDIKQTEHLYFRNWLNEKVEDNGNLQMKSENIEPDENEKTSISGKIIYNKDYYLKYTQKNKIKELLSELSKNFNTYLSINKGNKVHHKYDELVTLSKKWINIQKQEQEATISPQTAWVEKGRTIRSILDFINNLPKDYFDVLNRKVNVEDLDSFIEPKMVFIKGGTFQMGSEDKDAFDREKPVHQVTLDDFYIGKYAVTTEDYMIFVNETQSNYPEWAEQGNDYHLKTGKKNLYKGFTEDKQPIVGISWQNAEAYCKWLTQKTEQNYRLPTEAEWEYAARGGSESNNFKYAGSNSLDEVAWYYKNAGETTHLVGQKKPNELGLYDMSGNVYEWCQDLYEDYSSETQTNPQGPRSGVYHVLRGGSWNYYRRNCHVSYRNRSSPRRRSNDIGFRLAHS